MKPLRSLPIVFSIFLFACQSPPQAAPNPVRPTFTSHKTRTGHKKETGLASVYTDRRTVSGERFRAGQLTAAHRTFAFGTRVLVTCLRTGRSVIVRINDRGPFIRGRIIDLTPAAAARLGLTKKMGLTKVEISRLP